jgi:hypothetical protein
MKADVVPKPDTADAMRIVDGCTNIDDDKPAVRAHGGLIVQEDPEPAVIV